MSAAAPPLQKERIGPLLGRSSIVAGCFSHQANGKRGRCLSPRSASLISLLIRENTEMQTHIYRSFFLWTNSVLCSTKSTETSKLVHLQDGLWVFCLSPNHQICWFRSFLGFFSGDHTKTVVKTVVKLPDVHLNRVNLGLERIFGTCQTSAFGRLNI